jgi:hypothetical protein
MPSNSWLYRSVSRSRGDCLDGRGVPTDAVELVEHPHLSVVYLPVGERRGRLR